MTGHPPEKGNVPQRPATRDARTVSKISPYDTKKVSLLPEGYAAEKTDTSPLPFCTVRKGAFIK